MTYESKSSEHSKKPVTPPKSPKADKTPKNEKLFKKEKTKNTSPRKRKNEQNQVSQEQHNFEPALEVAQKYGKLDFKELEPNQLKELYEALHTLDALSSPVEDNFKSKKTNGVAFGSGSQWSIFQKYYSQKTTKKIKFL